VGAPAPALNVQGAPRCAKDEGGERALTTLEEEVLLSAVLSGDEVRACCPWQRACVQPRPPRRRSTFPACCHERACSLLQAGPALRAVYARGAQNDFATALDRAAAEREAVLPRARARHRRAWRR
jgi:hypothetical protein